MARLMEDIAGEEDFEDFKNKQSNNASKQNDGKKKRRRVAFGSGSDGSDVDSREERDSSDYDSERGYYDEDDSDDDFERA